LPAGHIAQTFDVSLHDQILRRITILAYSIRNHLDRFSFGFGCTQSRLSLTFCTQDFRLLCAFSTGDRSLLFAFGSRDCRLFLAVGLQNQRASISFWRS